MITEEQVIASFAKYLRSVVRKMQVENHRSETPLEANERLEATCEFETLKLQYEAQFVK